MEAFISSLRLHDNVQLDQLVDERDDNKIKSNEANMTFWIIKKIFYKNH
jgi:hypothetical protein